MELNSVSDDLLLHIFSFLDPVSLFKAKRVCKRWCNVATDDVLWEKKLLSDINTWKQITHACQSVEEDIPKHEMYIRSSPELQKWKRSFYQQSTLHQLTDFLRNLMPSKKYSFGVGASAMDSYGKGQSFFSRLLSFDTANVFQHCGQFPGRFRGHGGGFLFKYKRSILELYLMYVAPKSLRDGLTMDEKLSLLERHVKSEGFKQSLEALDGYVHTIDSRILDEVTMESTMSRLEMEAKEIHLLDKHLKSDIPVLILSCRKTEADNYMPAYQVTKVLHLQELKRPWMVSECSAQMIYRDIQDPMDWLICAAKSH